MRITLIGFVLTSLFLNPVTADDLYYKNGCIFKNMHIIDTSSALIKVEIHTGETRIIPKAALLKMSYLDFDHDSESIMINCETENDTFFWKNKKNEKTQELKRLSYNDKNFDNIDYFPVLLNGEIAYIDSLGKIILTPEIKTNYSSCYIVIHSQAKVEYIRHEADIEFSEGLVLLKEQKSRFSSWRGSNYKCFDLSGNLIFESNLDWIGSFKEGVAQVKVGQFFLFIQTGYKFGYIKKNGEYFIPPIYDFAGPFSEGMARIKKNDKFGYINKRGDIAIPLKFHYASDFSDGLAAVALNNKYGYINTTGNGSISPVFDFTFNFNNGVARIMVNGKYGYINKTGDYIVKPIYVIGSDFNEKMAFIKEKDLYGFINTKGEKIIEPQFSNCGQFCSGLAPVEKNTEWGYINQQGEVIIPFIYQLALPFNNGLGIVWEEDKPAYISKKGIIISPVIIDE